MARPTEFVEPKPISVTIEMETYWWLQDAKEATGKSVNHMVNKAIAEYLGRRAIKRKGQFPPCRDHLEALNKAKSAK